MYRARLTRARKAFSLLEVLFSLLITVIVGLTVLAGIIFSRQCLELDKQYVAALNYARQYLEAAEEYLDYSQGNYVLVPFNAPGAENINAAINVTFYRILADGTVEWNVPREHALANDPCLCRVTVSWNPAGTWSRERRVTMSSIVRRGAFSL